MKELQDKIDATIQQCGGYWPIEKIIIRLGEEFGEVCSAHRKKSKEEVMSELGDIIFTTIALANVLEEDLTPYLQKAIDKAIADSEQKS